VKRVAYRLQRIFLSREWRVVGLQRMRDGAFSVSKVLGYYAINFVLAIATTAGQEGDRRARNSECTHVGSGRR
jgi:hypothetical protein